MKQSEVPHKFSNFSKQLYIQSDFIGNHNIYLGRLSPTFWMPPIAGPECTLILKRSCSFGLCGITKQDAPSIRSNAIVAISEAWVSPSFLAVASGTPEATMYASFPLCNLKTSYLKKRGHIPFSYLLSPLSTGKWYGFSDNLISYLLIRVSNILQKAFKKKPISIGVESSQSWRKSTTSL